MRIQKRHQPVHERLATDLPYGAKVRKTEVDDPYSTDGEKILVLQSLRDDPLAGMLARRQIDQAQFEAGRQWQHFEEMAQIGGVSAIDPGKEAVDGGRIPEPFTDRHHRALSMLIEAGAELGIYGRDLVREIICERRTIKEAAYSRGRYTDWGVRATAREFKGFLDQLAVLWGFAGGLQI